MIILCYGKASGHAYASRRSVQQHQQQCSSSSFVLGSLVMADSRRGHVDRARTYGPGSVLARIADEQRQLQQEAVEEFAAAEDQEDEEEQAQVTWLELWDARTTAGFVGLQLQQDETSSKSLQCWWGTKSVKRKREQSSKSRSARLLQYSGVLARVVQRSAGRPPAAVAAQEPARATLIAVTQAYQLFNPASKRRRVEQAAQHEGVLCGGRQLTTAWACCNVTQQAAADSQPVNVLCGTPNCATAVVCAVCGAARWDGPDGQLQRRIMAALQTADQSATTYKQVTARVLAECGSRPGVGLVPPAGMHAEVKALGARRVTQAAAAGTGVPAGSRQLPRGSKPDSGWSVAAGQGLGGAAVDDELQLLDDYGCLPAALGVYNSLMTCLQQPQPQQQQQQQQAQQQLTELGHTQSHGLWLQSASAGAAAFAPGLLGSVLQQQAGAPAVRLHRLSVSSWVVDCFEAAAAAAAAAVSAAHAPTPHHQQQGSALPGQPCAALRRPLPLPTVLGLCDRQGAAVRQAIADAAADLVAACGGHVPVISRSYELEGFELMCEEVAPQVWLWACWDDDMERTRRLPAHSGISHHEEDVVVLEKLTCPYWEELRVARNRVHAWLEAWRRSLVHQQGGDPEPYLEYYTASYKTGRDSGTSYLTTVFPHLDWDSQMRKLLQRQVVRVGNAWGAAPTWGLQQGLSQQQPQQQPEEQQPQRSDQQGAGPAAAAGARRRARLRRQVVDVAALDEQLKGIIGCSDSGCDSSGVEFSGAEDDNGLSSEGQELDDCEHDTGRRRGRRKVSHSGTRQQGEFERQQQDMLEKACADHEAWLGSLDDLMLPQEMPAEPPAAAAGEAGTSQQAGQGVAQSAPQPWRPAANSLWRAVAAAGETGSAQRPGGMRAGGRTPGQQAADAPTAAGGWTDLPAGAQLLLGQAARAGLAPHVLQRTALRLNMMLKGTAGVTGNP